MTTAADPKGARFQGRSVALSGINKSFSGRPVLTDLGLDVAPGEFLAVLGPSGSGKTTMMRIIAGFESPDAGTVAIGDRDVTTLPAERRPVNTVFQSYALFPHLSVLDNVAFGPRMHGEARAARERRARDLLELVQLPDQGTRMPAELSGGMQQRVALARALANEPAVLLLDEPLGALDRKLREELQRELRRIHTELGTTFIYVTHDQDEAFGLADRLALIRDGRFVQIGTPGDVYDHPADAWVSAFLGAANSVPVRVSGRGAITSGAGPLVAGYVDAGLRDGDAAIAIIRPEATHIAAPGATAGQNRFDGRLIDRVAVGPSLRLRARTSDGVTVEAVAPRTQADATLNPGDAVAISFDPTAVRVYPAGNSHSPERHSNAPLP